MLVAQARENNVVSFGGEAEDFGVADIGVILEMLSTTLYTDKPRAVSREVLCNAFDAHFAAGREDLPVDVTIDEKQIEIRDYGHGIARDQIGPVYCTFAASTKTHDETQTGGHGVGAKSPFSITDLFTVISRCDGTLSTFSLFTTDRVPQHRYVGGRPCEDEGISVIIPLKTPNLGTTMRFHILRVAEDAGMKIRINGELFDFTKSMIFENDEIRITTRKSHRDAVDILYGRVIYPFQHSVDPALDALHKELSQMADRLRGRDGAITISVKAPPSSLATALSRESLSYTDRSIQNLSAQFRAAISGLSIAQAKASTLFLAANKITDWRQLVAMRTSSAGFTMPVANDPSVDLFLSLELQNWSARINDAAGVLNLAKATKSQIAWRHLRSFTKKPQLFHARKLAKVLGPFTREIRVVKPTASAYDVTRYAYLTGGNVAESRRLTPDVAHNILTRTSLVTIAPSLAAIEREKKEEGLYLIVSRKQRAQAEALLAGIERLGYSYAAIAEPEIVRTPRMPREARRDAEAREWPALITSRTSWGSRHGGEHTYKVSGRRMKPAAYLPLSFTGEGVNLPAGCGKMRFEDCLAAIAGGPIAFVRQVGQLRDASKDDIPEMATVIEAFLDEMRERVGEDAFFLAVKISRAALGTAYHDLYHGADAEKALYGAAAYFPATVASRIFPSATAVPSSSDILKLIAVRQVVALFKDGKCRLDKVLNSNSEKVRDTIAAAAAEQAAALQRIATIFRDAKPVTAALSTEVEVLDRRISGDNLSLKVAFKILNLNEYLADILNAALIKTSSEIADDARSRLDSVEATLRRMLTIQDSSHAA
jgi:hypothetical protein